MLLWFEIVGWAAAIIVIAALSVRQIVLRRVLLTAACLFVLLYALMTQQWPIAVIAVALGAYNGLRLRRELAPEPSDEIAAVPIDQQAPFLDDFLRANLIDIQRTQPAFTLETEAPFVRLITRRGLPAGVFLGRPEGTELNVVLDYVTPRYRDSRAGRWLMGDGKTTFTDAGFTRLVVLPATYEHQSYLEGLGFHPEGTRLVFDLD